MQTNERARPTARVATLVVAVVVALSAAACGSSDTGGGGGGEQGGSGGGAFTNVTKPASGAPKTGGKLVYGLEAETDGYNPTANRFAISGYMVANAVFDPLAAFDADGKAQPYLAQSFEPSPDYRTWTVTMRPGITFQNGEKADAAAVVTFINALKASTLTGAAARPIQSAEAVGDLQVKLTMSQPWVSFPNLMTGQGGMLAAPEQINNNISDKPIGTGPFKYKEWIRDARFVATRNPDYWRKDPSGAQYPYLAEVEFRPLPDVNTRINSLESGDVNIIHDNHPNQLERMKRAAERGDFQYIQGGGEDEETFLLLNMAKPPLDDVRVRQAIAYATNKDQYLDITGGDPSTAADSFLSKESPFYADVGFPTYDPAKARELVNAWKADHPGQEIELTITTTPTPENQQIIQAFAKQWEDVGIKASPQAVDQAQFILTGVTGKYDVNLWRQYSAPDPDGEYHWWTSENAGPIDSIALNFARLNDPQVDQALNTGRSNPDPAARKQAYVDLQRRFAELVPYVWLDHVQWALVADNTVRGILNAPLPDGQPSIPVQAGVHRLTQTWLDT